MLFLCFSTGMPKENSLQYPALQGRQIKGTSLFQGAQAAPVLHIYQFLMVKEALLTSYYRFNLQRAQRAQGKLSSIFFK